MQVARIKKGYVVTQHHPGVIYPWDSALCGDDLTGSGEDPEATRVEGRITCQSCAKIIHALKGIDRKEYLLGRKSDLIIYE